MLDGSPTALQKLCVLLGVYAWPRGENELFCDVAEDEDRKKKWRPWVVGSVVEVQWQDVKIRVDNREGGLWHTASMAAVSNSGRWRIVMAIHGGGRSEAMRVVQWTALAKWRDNGVGWSMKKEV